MKKITYLIIVLFFLTAGKSFPQIGDILKKIPGVEDVLFEEAVTTSIKDAYPTAYWLKDLDKQVDLITSESFRPDIPAGYYKFGFKTFCLHAGTYAPTEGAGYLVAPLKGAKSKLIKNVLRRYTEHPEIDQKDAQLLIWGIEANAKFSNYPADFQMRVAPLLTPDEIALMEVDVKDIAMDLLPQEVKDVLNLYSNMRQKLSDANSTYEDVEQLAVRTGIAPIGKGSKNIDAGTWASIGDGVYIRCFPHGYQQSDVEVYIPSEVEIKKDNKNRITSLSDGSNSIEFTYDDSPGGNALDGKYPINRFKSVTLSGDETMTINDRGWYIPSISKVSGSYSRSDDPAVQEYNDRKKAGEDFVKSVKKSMSKKKLKKFKDNNLKELKQLELSLRTLLEVNEINGNPAEKNYKLAVDALNRYAADVVSGHKKGGGKNKLTGIDASGLVFAPANTAGQRTAGGPGGPPTGNEGEKEKKKKECKPKITIKRVSPDLLPEPNAIFNVNIEIKIEGDEDCKVEGARFTLFDVSREIGRCLNDKDPGWYDTRLDFFIDPQFNTMMTVSPDSLSAESSSEITYVTIGCSDWGAYGKLKAEVKVKGQWYMARDEMSNSNLIILPYDIDFNHIADTWELDNKVLGLKADWDEDPEPSKQARNGDGITNYEEYRGFYVSDGDVGVEHVRTNPKLKELFVIDDDQIFDIVSWKAASGIKPYWLTKDLVYGTLAGNEENNQYRWVDFNRGYAPGEKYSILLVKAKTMDDPYNHNPDIYVFGYNHPVVGVPKLSTYTVVFPERINYWLMEQKDTLEALLKKFPNGYMIDGVIYKPWVIKMFIDAMKDSQKSQVISEFVFYVVTMHEVGHGCNAEHHGGGDTTKTATGDNNCPMIYRHSSNVASQTLGLGPIFNMIKKYGTIPSVTYTKLKFCKKKDNCWGQLDVNDR